MSALEQSYLPLSALQHYLFCPRQCALIHLEREWRENRYTAEGRVMHRRAHEAPDESRPGIRVTRGLPVASSLLGLSGQCDVVEFRDDGTITPVEYKRGKPKAHRADEVQLCAQAIALEEMLGLPVGAIFSGALYYGKKRRRTIVTLDKCLRDLTADVARQMHAMFSSGKTPAPVYDEAKCEACSLYDVCMPLKKNGAGVASAYFRGQLETSLSE